MDIIKTLFDLSSTSFRNFNIKLIPTVDPKRVIGVKTPELRDLAKELIKSGEYSGFLDELPHRYFDEDQLHAFIIGELRDFDEALFEVERFLPYIDNWATCDQLIPRSFKKNKSELLPLADKWISSGHTYTVRYGIAVYMRYFLDADFKREYLDKIASIKTDEYYINMMSAWYFATGLSKQRESVLPYLEQGRLFTWVHNKTISKAMDSYRISNEDKKYLKALIRK